MPRNIERDEKEAMRRKEQLMEAGFRLFSQYGIENVSLQRVADAAEVGVATLYNYYQTKVKLVIAISGKIWGDLWKEILEEKGYTIDEDGFKEEMEVQRKRARESRAVSNYMGADATVYDEIDRNIKTGALEPELALELLVGRI